MTMFGPTTCEREKKREREGEREEVDRSEERWMEPNNREETRHRRGMESLDSCAYGSVTALR